MGVRKGKEGPTEVTHYLLALQLGDRVVEVEYLLTLLELLYRQAGLVLVG